MEMEIIVSDLGMYFPFPSLPNVFYHVYHDDRPITVHFFGNGLDNPPTHEIVRQANPLNNTFNRSVTVRQLIGNFPLKLPLGMHHYQAGWGERVDIVWMAMPESKESSMVACNDYFVAVWSHHQRLFVIRALRVMLLEENRFIPVNPNGDHDWELAVHLEATTEGVRVKNCTLEARTENNADKYQALVVHDGQRPRNRMQIGNVYLDVRPGSKDCIFSKNDFAIFGYSELVDAWAQVKDFSKPLTRSHRRQRYDPTVHHTLELRYMD